MNSKIVNSTDGMPVISGKPYSGTLSWLCNLHPRSTQNIDFVSSINFSNLSVSCLFILLLIQLKTINIHVTRVLGRYSDNNSNSTVTVTVIIIVDSISNHVYDEQ